MPVRLFSSAPPRGCITHKQAALGTRPERCAKYINQHCWQERRLATLRVSCLLGAGRSAWCCGWPVLLARAVPGVCPACFVPGSLDSPEGSFLTALCEMQVTCGSPALSEYAPTAAGPVLVQSIGLHENPPGLGTALSHMTPVPAGEAISNSESIRRAHNSFSPPQAIVPEETKHPDEEGDAFHFICYIHRSGHVWELDGLKAGPIKLGACNEVCAQPSVVGPALVMQVLRHPTIVLLGPSELGTVAPAE